MKNTFLQKTGTFFFSFIFLLSSGITFPSTIPTVAAEGTWDRQKATHLAYRALIAPSLEDINNLANAGSADAAVELLFAEPSAQEKEEYEQILQEFYDDESYDRTTSVDLANEYILKRWKNPEEAKEKLFLLFEDILSINQSGAGPRRIEFSNWHDTIYDSLDGEYSELIKRTMREFGQAFYLNLLNGNKDNPNQDFARELLQLFLMEELPPVEGLSNIALEENGKNYTEEDMIAVSFLVTGYRFVGQNFPNLPAGVLQCKTEEGCDNKFISFTKPDGTDSPVFFHRGYHNTATQTMFGEDISIPVGKDPAEIVVPFVFEKKKEAIANFIGWKLVNHYVNTNPTANEVTVAANILKANNFHIINSVKDILKHDIMYSNDSMEEFRFKSPVEMVIGMMKQVNPSWHSLRMRSAPDRNPSNFPYSYLARMGFAPLQAPSIFGRDAMDNNRLWMNESIYSLWQGDFGLHLVRFLLLQEENIAVKNLFQMGENETTAAYIDRMIDIFFPGKTLEETRKQLIKGHADSLLNDGSISDSDMYSILRLLVAQPEYLLLSGENIQPIVEEEKLPYENDHVVIYNWLRGAPDQQHLLIPTHDTNYAGAKGDLHVPEKYTSPLIDKNGEENTLYRANTYAMGESMLRLYKEGKLHIFQGVANVGQTKSHYAARIVAETGVQTGEKGYLTKMLQNKATLSQIQSRRGSNIYKGMQNVVLPSSKNSIRPSLKMLYENKQTLPGLFATIIPSAYKTLENMNKEENSFFTGTTPEERKQDVYDYFLETVQSQDAVVLTDTSDGGFDSHKNLAPYLLDENQGKDSPSTNKGFENTFKYSLNKYTDTLEKFEEMYPNKELSIVLYGEFGRTTVPNKTYGNDHGRGALFLVLSTDDTLFSGIPQFMGISNTNDNPLNYQPTSIDRRSIWDHFFQHVYNIDTEKRKELFGEILPLPLEVYAKRDEIYKNIYDQKVFQGTSVEETLILIDELKNTIASQEFYKNYFLQQVNILGNHFARVLSFPVQGKSLLSQFSFENTLGDSDYNSFSFFPVGNSSPRYENGVSGKALLFTSGEEFNNDRYGHYTKQIEDDETVSKKGNSIFFWISPETLKTRETLLFENVRMGGRVSLSNIGENGGKKLKIQYRNGDSIDEVLTIDNSQNINIHEGEWVQVSLISDIENKKFSISLNGNIVATKENITNIQNNYKYRIGNTSTGTDYHSILFDEFTSYSRVFSEDEILAKYVQDRLLLTSISPEEGNELLKKIPSSNIEKPRLEKQRLYKEMNSMSFKIGDEGKKVSECLKDGSNNILDGEIQMQWNGTPIHSQHNASSVENVFLKGLEENSIDFSYNISSKIYTVKTNPLHEEIVYCYLKNNTFFTSYFTVL